MSSLNFRFKQLFFISSFLLMAHFGFSQSVKKKLQTQFTSEKIVIDGKFDEACWQKADIA